MERFSRSCKQLAGGASSKRGFPIAKYFTSVLFVNVRNFLTSFMVKTCSTTPGISMVVVWYVWTWYKCRSVTLLRWFSALLVLCCMYSSSHVFLLFRPINLRFLRYHTILVVSRGVSQHSEKLTTKRRCFCVIGVRLYIQGVSHKSWPNLYKSHPIPKTVS